jgi:Fe-S oxidoreductase
MATYKAEFLYHHYARRIRPAAHYSMGWLPLWSVLAHAAPTLVNRLTHTEPFARIVKRVGGVQPERPMPVFARHRFTDWFRDRPERPDAPHGDVMIWPDSFTNNFHPAIGRAAVRVLEDAGYRVRIPDQTLCCALTWISTGQLGVAKRILKHTARTLADQLGDSMALIGLEPSCTAVFRSDGPELLPDDDDVALLKQRTRTLAEVLRDTPGYEPPAIDRTAVVQPHCHQHAVMRFDADRELMDRMGLVPDVVGGCCGLAGNFGFEDGHLDVSVACAEHELLPAVRGADPTAVIVADGFSCRTQLDQTGEGRRAVHLAELIAAGLDGLSAHDEPERDILDRPGRAERIPSRVLSAARSALPGRRS